MDQLKVLLEHRFWLLSALAILIPPIGWWVSTGDMAMKTDSRTKAIAGKVSTLKTLEEGVKKQPTNKDWIDGGNQLNAKLATRVDDVQRRLYEHQVPAMVWNPLVKKELDAAHVKYRGDLAGNPQAFLAAKRLFMTRYPDMWQTNVYKVVAPFDVVTGEGKVLCTGDQQGTSAVQITRAPAEPWQQRQMAISSEELWNAQEDLWMLHALMQAVARVNEGSMNIDDARIKRLLSVTLRGGNTADLLERRKKKQNQNAPAGQPAGAPSGGGGFGLQGFSAGTGGRSEAENAPKALPMIEPDDIFGTESDATVGPVGGGGKRAAGEPAAARQYVEENPGKWRSRGFVLRLVMDHQEIPKLLTTLTESPFPVQIWHVEHLSPYDFQKNRQQVNAPAASEADSKRIKDNEDRLAMAMNQVNLAEVLVAGTFLLYDEPAAAGASTAAPSTPATSGKSTPAAKATTGAAAATTGAKPGAPAGTAPAAPATGTPPAGNAPAAKGQSPATTSSAKSASSAAPSVPTPKSSAPPAPKTQPPGASPAKSGPPGKS
jgi:hypothetical protein